MTDPAGASASAERRRGDRAVYERLTALVRELEAREGRPAHDAEPAMIELRLGAAGLTWRIAYAPGTMKGATS